MEQLTNIKQRIEHLREPKNQPKDTLDKMLLDIDNIIKNYIRNSNVKQPRN